MFEGDVMKKVFGIILICSQGVFATGISKSVLIGPKAIGLGGAFVGVADDATNVFHNAAAMTQLEEHRFFIGADSLLTDLDYTPPGGATEKAKTEFLPVPAFAYVTNVAKPLSLGFGLFFPHGNGGKFASASASPFNPNEGRIYSMELLPSAAWKFHDYFSIGASLRLVRMSSSLKGQTLIVEDAPLTLDTVDNLKVADWGVGYAVSIFSKPCKQFSFGANYRSKVETNLDGNATFAASGPVSTLLGAQTTPAMLGQTLPSNLTAGAGWHPNDRSTLAFGYQFERNSEVKELNASVANGALAIPPIPQNWKDSHTLHIGGEYWFLDFLAARAGYAKDLNSSIPDGAMNRILGDIASHEVSFGLATRFKNFDVGLTWNGRFGERDIPVTATNPSPGHTEAFINSFSFGLGYKI